MEEVYGRLAALLDAIPNGFPATTSGVELRLLARLFTPEEAELACHLETESLPSAAIAELAGRDEPAVRSLLKSMLGKGLIEARKTDRGIGFRMIPFIVGFYEGQKGRIDEDFAALFEEYQKEALHRVMSIKPSVHRVVPIEKAIPIGIEVMPYERASHYVRNARAWGVLPCICRVQKRLVGKACGHSEETCLILSDVPGAFGRGGGFRALTMEGALEVLAKAAEEGLVHSTSNVESGVSYICNCCTCSCGVLRGFVDYGYEDSIGKSDFLSEVVTSLCTGCGLCVERCPFKAIELRDGLSSIDLAHCYGCGQCVGACPTGALSLRMKPVSEIERPAATEAEWNRARAAARKA